MFRCLPCWAAAAFGRYDARVWDFSCLLCPFVCFLVAFYIAMAWHPVYVKCRSAFLDCCRLFPHTVCVMLSMAWLKTLEPLDSSLVVREDPDVFSGAV